MQLLTSVGKIAVEARVQRSPLSCLFIVLYLCMCLYIYIFFLICCLIAESEVNRMVNCTSEPVRDLCCSISALEDYTPGLFTLLLYLIEIQPKVNAADLICQKSHTSDTVLRRNLEFFGSASLFSLL